MKHRNFWTISIDANDYRVFTAVGDDLPPNASCVVTTPTAMTLADAESWFAAYCSLGKVAHDTSDAEESGVRQIWSVYEGAGVLLIASLSSNPPDGADFIGNTPYLMTFGDARAWALSHRRCSKPSIGDVVYLNGHAQPMTVGEVDDGLAKCAWFGATGELQMAEFPLAALRLGPPFQPTVGMAL